MTCRVPFFLLASFAVALAPASLHAEPEVKGSWWRKIPLIGRLISPDGEVKKTSMPRLRLAEFTGGTGASAKTGLQDELLASREFFVATGEETADFTLNGSSIGGRVNGRLLDKKGKQLFERSYAAPGLDENIKALADDVIYTITGKPGLATSRIVFVSDKSGRKQVYVCDSDGREVQQVTHDRHAAVSPTISPDASMIAFTSYRSGFPDVRLMDIHSGWEREVSDTPGSSAGPAFSPDGSRLAMVMSFIGNPEIFVRDLNSNTAACISDSVGAPGSPSWHPDGKRIAFSNDDGGGSSIYIVEVPEKEGQATRLFRWSTGWGDSTDPEWSPDGKQLAFTARSSGQWIIGIKSYAGGGSKVIQRGGAMHPSWSPNGRYLCYTQHGELFIHEIATGGRRSILKNFGRITEPRWMR
jgi:TolB protein